MLVTHLPSLWVQDGLNGIGEVFLRHFLDYLGDGLLRATFEDQARLWSKKGLFAQLNEYVNDFRCYQLLRWNAFGWFVTCLRCLRRFAYALAACGGRYIRNPKYAVGQGVDDDGDGDVTQSVSAAGSDGDASTRPSDTTGHNSSGGVSPPSAQFDCVGALKQHNRVKDVVRILYKVDDDLRQDQLVLDLLRTMQQLWHDGGVGDLHLACYHLTPTWKDGGLLQIVPESQTLFKIDNELGGLARYLHLDDDSIGAAVR